MPITRLRPSFTFTQDRLQQLKSVVPEALADGKINWDVLREAMGEYLADEEDEQFGLFWPGKRGARRLASMPSKGTLVPAPGEGVNEAQSRNIFIEGENLEVLKLLQKGYAGRVKMIYIDPPYNTGNDLIYSDEYAEPMDAYLRRTGQLGEREELLTSNTKASGRYHSHWLSMMYPRLVLARQLLSRDGVIFISIDDNEVANLREICAEAFGEENFVGTFTWETKRAARGVPPTSLLMSNHEYIICYANDATNVHFRGLDRDEADFGNPDNDPRGLWRSESIRATGSQDNYFTIPDPATGNEFHGNWAFSEKAIARMIGEGLILFPPSQDGTPRQKKFIDSYRFETKAGVTALGWHSTERSTTDLMELFDGKKVFDFPKPLSLIGYLCDQALIDGDIVLDFFAGSSTTAHATMRQNLKDGGSRQFIMVQLPELVPEDSTASTMGLRTVADIGKERIRRAIKRLGEESATAASEETTRDDGLSFKVVKLSRSQLRQWLDYEGEDFRDYQMRLGDSAKSALADGWRKEDVLAEIVLHEGFPLDSAMTTQGDFKANDVYCAQSGFRSFGLWLCLDEQIKEETAERLLHLPKEDVFICIDNALTDELKMRLADAINLHVI